MLRKLQIGTDFPIYNRGENVKHSKRGDYIRILVMLMDILCRDILNTIYSFTPSIPDDTTYKHITKVTILICIADGRHLLLDGVSCLTTTACDSHSVTTRMTRKEQYEDYLASHVSVAG